MSDKELINSIKEYVDWAYDTNIAKLTYDEINDFYDLVMRQQKQLDNYSHNVRNMSKDFIDQQKIIQEQRVEIQALREDIHNRKARENKLRSKIKSFKTEIERLKTEIEKLNVELVGMRGACNSYKMHYDNAKAEIERLENSYKQCAYERDVFLRENPVEMALLIDEQAEKLKTIETEAIKEFAERLKEKAYLNDGVTGFQDVIVEVNDIDNLVEEMVGEGK